jgi:hypothetical protein
MKLSELMDGVTPDPEFEGFSTADDMVLALNFGASAAEPWGYAVAQRGVTEASGTLEAETMDAQYLRTGRVTQKTGTSRAFTVTGDKYYGDEFQDTLMSHDVKYGTGQAVIKDYVYFNMLTGKGEKGKISIAVEDDLAGAAGENASFTATLSSTEKPEEYTWEGEFDETDPDPLDP